MESFHDILSLCPEITGWHICVKVLRSFTVQVTPAEKSMTIIVADEKGKRLEGTIRHRYVKYYEKFIEEGQWITIMHFVVRPNDDVIMATDHEYKIFFIDQTIVKNAQPITESGGNHLTSLSSIIEDTVPTDFLIDVVGAVFDVGHLHNLSGNVQNMDGWRIVFKLQDKDNNVLMAQARGKEALHFNENYMPYRHSSLVVGLRFWKIDREFSGRKNVLICTNGPISKVYPNPNIPEAREIHDMLANDVVLLGK